MTEPAMFMPDEILRSTLKTHNTLASEAFHLPLVLEDKHHLLMQQGRLDIPVVGSLLKLGGQIPVKQNSTQFRDFLSLA